VRLHPYIPATYTSVSRGYHIKRWLSGNLPKYRPPAHGVLVTVARYTRTSLQMPTVERWVRMFSSIKYEHFVQVSSNQKHILKMFADVRRGQESISKQPWYILPAVMRFACSHARISQSAEIRSAFCNHVADCLVTLHFNGSGL